MEATDKTQLLNTLKERFNTNLHRHPSIESWESVEKKIINNSNLLETLYQMETSGGEPDVVIFQEEGICFCDCSKESPKERRSLCYDLEAWNSRKENKPKGNAIELASSIGVQILDESQYKQLQAVEEFDLKTSSWLLTPSAIRSKKGAIFGDRRYDHTFIYHNGAESYYAARGFRGYIAL